VPIIAPRNRRYTSTFTWMALWYDKDFIRTGEGDEGDTEQSDSAQLELIPRWFGYSRNPSLESFMKPEV